ncbi:hypothetical protein [Streptomyces sp. NPDC002671]
MISYKYPQDLIDTQTELDEVHDALKNFFGGPPGPVEPRNTRGSLENALWRSPRRSSQGLAAPDDAAKVARLRARAAELVGKIVAHRFWSELDPADVPTAWDALRDSRERQSTASST